MNQPTTKRVLDIGQCGYDHPRIKALVENSFDVVVDRAHLADEAYQLIRENTYELVMINRLLDQDRSEGMEILKELKKNEATAGIPVMVISNFEDAQSAAMAEGAVRGFGKNALSSPETVATLSEVLGAPAAKG